MNKRIKLIKNNDKKDWADLEWITEFYQFLQGNVPDRITMGHGHGVKLTPKKAFSVIWYLQEHLPVFPDQIERCDVCSGLYDSYASGNYSEKREKHFCGACDDGKD